MRGKLAEVSDLVFRSRITPAHAGKTFLSSDLHFSQADHPRACGENRVSMSLRRTSIGSPPRMRGKQILIPKMTMDGRITPAHAGKTRAGFHHHLHSPDHPRACGENLICADCQISGCGSPPRMRGKRGKGVVRNCRNLDHPRACGENITTILQSIYAIGSPPRMRGKPVQRMRLASAPRITPAHAGKTDGVTGAQKTGGDHPRACGENTSEMLYFRG